MSDTKKIFNENQAGCKVLSKKVGNEVLFDALSKNNTGLLLELGIPGELIEFLSKLTLQEARFLSESTVPILHLSAQVIPENLATLRERICIKRQEDELREKYVKNGATFKMLSDLFGVTLYECNNLRKQFGVEDRGRPTMPDEATQRQIWMLWNENEDVPERERYLILSEQLYVPLKSIYAVLQKWAHEGVPA